jgi:hypothetical protein
MLSSSPVLQIGIDLAEKGYITHNSGIHRDFGKFILVTRWYLSHD